MKTRDLSLLDIGPKLVGSLQLYVARPQKIKEVFKPISGSKYKVVWTSSAKRSKDMYTSAWVEWCKDQMPHWLSSTGKLYEIKSGARILKMNTDKDAAIIGAHYGHAPFKKLFDTETIKWITNYPWEEIQNDFDAVHHEPSGSRMMNFLMSSWDVESTAWFNTNHLEYIDDVRIKVE